MAEEKGRVCVTGAGGYVGSWLVKLLLSKDMRFMGLLETLVCIDVMNNGLERTVKCGNFRAGDEKNAHLRKLDKASENLKLFKADLLDYSSLLAAIEGCIGVFHVASPVPSGAVPNPEVELIEPAITGTLNVLKACSEIRVKRVVVVSSVTAVLLNPSWPRDKVKDEACWSDKEYCRATKHVYTFPSATISCLMNVTYLVHCGFSCPMNATYLVHCRLQLVPSFQNCCRKRGFGIWKENMLDVVTVCPCFVFGPMLQSTTNTSSLFLIKILRVLLTRRKNSVESEKLQKLGWNYRSLEQTLIDSVQSYQDAGLISKD
ncbi:hypothetical protein GIB67_010005 [Kingdonia uniflora]|uniref:3-beta hydroxysteroid dehydrogenase/isomerase domain-containing protein n=1 Tax=Kingdonia uniflora TaxID=39325 RepID=A0A7J7M8B3_9MAGN|nr:hypothetical protein GIB67_010005 [Kingdonia uniflora]